MMTLENLIQEASQCRHCADKLPLGPRPVFRVKQSARLMIISQAPGTKVHETGLPFNDRSGERLRDWLHMDREAFYDEQRVAIMPMGFCYPGKNKGGDNPPRPECAPLWHQRFHNLLPNIRLTLLVGSYAQIYYLGKKRKKNMTETVLHFREYLPDYLPLPHPSWHNNRWLAQHEWFETELLPVLRQILKGL